MRVCTCASRAWVCVCECTCKYCYILIGRLLVCILVSEVYVFVTLTSEKNTFKFSWDITWYSFATLYCHHKSLQLFVLFKRTERSNVFHLSITFCLICYKQFWDVNNKGFQQLLELMNGFVYSKSDLQTYMDKQTTQTYLQINALRVLHLWMIWILTKSIWLIYIEYSIELFG